MPTIIKESVSWKEVTYNLQWSVVNSMNRFNSMLYFLDEDLNHNYPERYEQHKKWAVSSAYNVIKSYELLCSLRRWLGYRSAEYNQFSDDMNLIYEFLKEYDCNRPYSPDNALKYKVRDK